MLTVKKILTYCKFRKISFRLLKYAKLEYNFYLGFYTIVGMLCVKNQNNTYVPPTQ